MSITWQVDYPPPPKKTTYSSFLWISIILILNFASLYFCLMSCYSRLCSKRGNVLADLTGHMLRDSLRNKATKHKRYILPDIFIVWIYIYIYFYLFNKKLNMIAALVTDPPMIIPPQCKINQFATPHLRCHWFWNNHAIFKY